MYIIITLCKKKITLSFMKDNDLVFFFTLKYVIGASNPKLCLSYFRCKCRNQVTKNFNETNTFFVSKYLKPCGGRASNLERTLGCGCKVLPS